MRIYLSCEQVPTWGDSAWIQRRLTANPSPQGPRGTELRCGLEWAGHSDALKRISLPVVRCFSQSQMRGTGLGCIGKIKELPAHQALQGSRDNGSVIGNKTVASSRLATNDEALSLWAISTAIFWGSIRCGSSVGQAGVDLPCPPIIPASFRTAESPEVLSCTPVVHQSGQPSTRFRESSGNGTWFERVLCI